MTPTRPRERRLHVGDRTLFALDQKLSLGSNIKLRIIKTVDVHDSAKRDLLELAAVDPDAWATVVVVLEQLKADPCAIDKLTTYGDNPIGSSLLNVKPWESAKGRGNLWRFRILNTPATNYRVVYGYQWQTRQLCVLAVVKKEEFDYDDHDSEIANRILRDWRYL